MVNSRSTEQAFESAIASGHFSTDESAFNYVGHYMYMGSDDNRDFFKDSTTRQYSNRCFTGDHGELVNKHNRLLQVAIDTGSDAIALEQNINAVRIELGLDEITLYDGLLDAHLALMVVA